MRVKANGINLWVERHGDVSAPPLVLIRGLGSQIAHWADALIEGFVDAGFHVVTFDNRDVGMSDRCPVPGLDCSADGILARVAGGEPLGLAYRLDDMALDVVGLLDALGIRRAHVWGMSMGGAITQLMAIRHADRLLTATIVMSSARPIGKRGFEEGRLRLLLNWPMTEAEAEAEAVPGYASYGSPGFDMSEAEIREMARAAYTRGHDADGVNRQFMASFQGEDRRPGLARVTTACHVIHGLDDTLLTPDLGREIAEAIPGARHDEIPGLGHVITPKAAPVLVKLTREFIGTQAGPQT